VQYRRLGRTEIEVSVVCCGTMAMCPHPTYGEPDDAESITAVHTALAAGINFFDTAEGYGGGYAEEVLGRALERRRGQAVIATKVSSEHLSPAELMRSCDESLRRLRTDYIDLYQVHWPSRQVAFAETAAALERLCEQGKVRAWGVSNFGRLDLKQALGAGAPVSNQLPYSLLWRAIEHEVLPLCDENAMSVICYSPMGQGLLTGKFARPADVPAPRRRARYCRDDVIELSFDVIEEVRAISGEIEEPMSSVALAWLLARPAVTAVIAGVRTAEQVTENVRAGLLTLPQGMVERLDRISLRLKNALDANPDMWQEAERSRYR
jgi:aryl-alcohol dehydrogenase-like predicted oxidoreductase